MNCNFVFSEGDAPEPDTSGSIFRDKSALPSQAFIDLSVAAIPAYWRVVYPDRKRSCRLLSEPAAKGICWLSPYWGGVVVVRKVWPDAKTLLVEPANPAVCMQVHEG